MGLLSITKHKAFKRGSGYRFTISTYAKCIVTQSFPFLITFESLIMSKKVKDIVQ